MILKGVYLLFANFPLLEIGSIRKGKETKSGLNKGLEKSEEFSNCNILCRYYKDRTSWQSSKFLESYLIFAENEK